MVDALHEIESRMGEHEVRIVALEASMYGDSSRLLRGHEERLQLLERAVSELTANWARLAVQLQTLASVGRVIAWLLGFVGIGLIANVARSVTGGG